jgi:hypothetical protein
MSPVPFMSLYSPVPVPAFSPRSWSLGPCLFTPAASRAPPTSFPPPRTRSTPVARLRRPAANRSRGSTATRSPAPGANASRWRTRNSRTGTATSNSTGNRATSGPKPGSLSSSPAPAGCRGDGTSAWPGSLPPAQQAPRGAGLAGPEPGGATPEPGALPPRTHAGNWMQMKPSRGISCSAGTRGGVGRLEWLKKCAQTPRPPASAASIHSHRCYT